MAIRQHHIILLLLFTFFFFLPGEESKAKGPGKIKYAPNGLTDVQSLNSGIMVSLAYSTSDNFLGEDVYGDLEICFLRKEAAEKLSRAQKILAGRNKEHHLLVYDGLRPREVQYKMWNLVKGTKEQKYVANPARGSIHNYGAAVDLTIADESGAPLDMGTPFDYFGELAQPRHEAKFLKRGMLTTAQVENRKLLRSVMKEAGFYGISIEWWHFNAFPTKEVKARYDIVEFLLPERETKSVLKEAERIPRDNNGYCLLIKGDRKKIYLIKGNGIQRVFDVAIGQKGLGKTREGDRKTPLGDYRIKWMLSRNGPDKANPGGVSSKVVNGRTYAVLDTELYFGELSKIRVKELADGTRKVSGDPKDRPITREEIKIAKDEKLWTRSYGGKNTFVMALDYPNKKDKAEGKTGSCIEIHASANLEKKGYKNYPGTYGCVSMYSDYARSIYSFVNPGTPVRITH